jgi:DNA-binding transcriptional LysR family regulator
LGFLLFDRVKRGVRLTAAGQRLLERSQLILGEVDRLKETLQIEAQCRAGRLRSPRRPRSAGCCSTGSRRRS